MEILYYTYTKKNTRAGAVGINLTQANRVFLMEPCLNPALELQAIGRVHRLGQKRKVEIVRIVMTNTVETRLMKVLKRKYGKSNDTNTTKATRTPTPTTASAAAITASNKKSKAMEEEEEDEDFNQSKKATATATTAAATSPGGTSSVVGCVSSDRTTILTEEFDILFGDDDNNSRSHDGGSSSVKSEQQKTYGEV